MQAQAQHEPKDLPLNYEVEQALLAALLSDNGLVDEVTGRLKPEHFAEDVHGRIFGNIAERVASGRSADYRTVALLFDQDKALSGVNGGEYIRGLQQSSVVLLPHVVKDWAETLRHLWTRRQLVQLSEEIEAAAQDRLGDVSPAALIERAEAVLFELTDVGGEGGPQRLGDILGDTIAEIEHKRLHGSSALSSGYLEVDQKTGGLEAPELIVLAGRPSMGKTTLATNMALRMAKAGRAPLIFSLEMGGKAVARRILAEQSSVPFLDLQRARNIHEAEQAQISAANQELSEFPIWLDDRSGLSIHQMHAAAKRLARQQPLSVIVIDHLGYVKPPDPKANAVDRIGDVMKEAKAMGKDLKVPVLMLCQLNRALLQRDDKRPRLDDLRGSGNIEEDADAIWFVHRDAYYLEREEPQRSQYDDINDHRIAADKWQSRMNDCRNTLDILFAKQRNGPVCACKLYFDGEHMRVGDLEQTEMDVGYGG